MILFKKCLVEIESIIYGLLIVTLNVKVWIDKILLLKSKKTIQRPSLRKNKS